MSDVRVNVRNGWYDFKWNGANGVLQAKSRRNSRERGYSGQG